MESTIRELISGYMQKAERKLEAADELYRSEYYEDAVSRAYYAVFHVVQALLLTEGQKADTHKGVVTLFSLLFVKTGKFSRDMGKYVVNLKDDRESGDYEVFSYIDRETAETAREEARKFIEESKAYLGRLGMGN